MGFEPLTTLASKAIAGELCFTGSLLPVMGRAERLQVTQGVVHWVVDVINLVGVSATTSTVDHLLATVAISFENNPPNSLPVRRKFSSSNFTIPSYITLPGITVN